MTAEALRALADEVEGLPTQGNFDVECRILTTLFPEIDVTHGVATWTSGGSAGTRISIPAYTRSIDAAAALMPDGWSPEIIKVQHRWRAMGIPSPGGIAVVGFGATEPLARTACALRAIAADIEAKETTHV